jgi:hypothetical protein
MTKFGSNIKQRLFRPTALTALAAIMLALSSSGCVQRRMTIRSNPPGALVYVDDYEIGTTPVSTNFTYYGTRKIRLVKDGYETLTVMQNINTPWYEYPPLEFISENFVPGKITDRRTLDYQLRPQMVVPTDQLRSRAEELRRNAHGSATVPPPQPTTAYPQPQPQPVVPAGNYPPAASPPFTPPPNVPAPIAPQPSAPAMVPPSSGIGGQRVYPTEP